MHDRESRGRVDRRGDKTFIVSDLLKDHHHSFRRLECFAVPVQSVIRMSQVYIQSGNAPAIAGGFKQRSSPVGALEEFLEPAHKK